MSKCVVCFNSECKCRFNGRTDEKISVFELDTGCTDWIVARNRQEALDHYQSLAGLSDEDMDNISVREIPYEKLESYQYFGAEDEEGDASNFKKEFDKIKDNHEEIPCYFASSEY